LCRYIANNLINRTTRVKCICVRNFIGYLFCFNLTEFYKRRRNILTTMLCTYGERSSDIISHIRTCINFFNNLIRKHTMIYAHRSRIPDSSRTRMKSVIDNVNAPRFIPRNLFLFLFLSNTSLSELARLHYLLILFISSRYYAISFH